MIPFHTPRLNPINRYLPVNAGHEVLGSRPSGKRRPLWQGDGDSLSCTGQPCLSDKQFNPRHLFARRSGVRRIEKRHHDLRLCLNGVTANRKLHRQSRIGHPVIVQTEQDGEHTAIHEPLQPSQRYRPDQSRSGAQGVTIQVVVEDRITLAVHPLIA